MWDASIVPPAAGVGPWGFVNFHPMLFYGKRGGVGSRPLSMESFATSEESDHPCPKPIKWMTWALSLTDSQTVLDTFAGSGTTLRAAKDLGRKAIGIEIEERYCEIAAKRMAQEVLAL